MIDQKFVCAKHNKNFTLIISDDRMKNYICRDCEKERNGGKL